MIVVNAGAGGGRGEARWHAVAAALREAGQADPVAPGLARLAAGARVCRGLDAARAALAEAADARPPLLVAAGGDGAVNLALNALMDPATDRPRWDAALGAIGLGSSNDFHKPFGPRLAGAPVALGAPAPRDVGRIDGEDAAGGRWTAFFLLNASLGLTADGNHRYNHPGPALAWIKRRLGADAAIAAATLAALAAYAPVDVAIALDGGAPAAWRLANLGVVKRVHFAGALRYDTPVRPDDGCFDVNLAEAGSPIALLRGLADLARGRFLASRAPGLHHRRARLVELVPARPTPLEYDGEVATIARATLRVLPGALRVASPGLPGSPPPKGAVL